MTEVSDSQGVPLQIYDLVVLERIPVELFVTAEQEEEVELRDETNARLESCIGRHAMIYPYDPKAVASNWSRDNQVSLLVMLAQGETVVTFRLSLPFDCLRRLAPDPILAYPYAMFRMYDNYFTAEGLTESIVHDGLI